MTVAGAFLCVLTAGAAGCDGSTAGDTPPAAGGSEANGGGAASSGGAGSSGAGSSGGASATDGGTSADGSPVVPGGNGGPGGTVGTCSPTCTGSSMCDDAGACVCAPGFIASGTSCVASAVTPPATRTKSEVCARYATETARPAVVWKPGAANTCEPGTVPYDAQIAALRYLNFYRWMLGVGPVQVIPEVANDEQACAIILNSEFSHSPATTTKCYTAAGAAACGNSLIAGGFDVITQFDGYALEVEQNLIHRRNVLSVGRAGVWTGMSGGSSDMHYGGSYPALATDPAYVAHPGPGPNVRSKVPSRWFVERGTATIPAVDARVFVKATNEPKPMTRYHHYTDFSSFDLAGWTPAVDVPYRVELVDDGGAVVSTYETTFVDCP